MRKRFAVIGMAFVAICGLMMLVAYIPSSEAMPAPFYVITTLPGPGGTIEPPGPVRVYPHDNQTFTIRPDAGYFIDKVRVDGIEATLTNNTYEFRDVVKDYVIEATFTQAPPPQLALKVEYMPRETIIQRRYGPAYSVQSDCNYPEVSFLTLRLMQRDATGKESLYEGGISYKFDIDGFISGSGNPSSMFNPIISFMFMNLTKDKGLTFNNYPENQDVGWHGFYYAVGSSGLWRLDDIIRRFNADEIGNGYDKTRPEYGQGLRDIVINGENNPVAIAVISWADDARGRAFTCRIRNGTYMTPLDKPPLINKSLVNISLNVNNAQLVRDDPDGSIKTYKNNKQAGAGNFISNPGDFIVKGGENPDAAPGQKCTYDYIVWAQYNWEVKGNYTAPASDCVDWAEVAVSDICNDPTTSHADVFKCLWSISTFVNNNEDAGSFGLVDRACPYLARFRINGPWMRFNAGGPTRNGFTCAKGRDAVIYGAALKCYAYLHGLSVFDADYQIQRNGERLPDSLYVGNMDPRNPMPAPYLDYSYDDRKRGAVDMDSSRQDLIQMVRNSRCCGDSYHNDRFIRRFLTEIDGGAENVLMWHAFSRGDLLPEFDLGDAAIQPDFPFSPYGIDIMPKITYVCFYKSYGEGKAGSVMAEQAKWLLDYGHIELVPIEARAPDPNGSTFEFGCNGYYWPHKFVIRLKGLDRLTTIYEQAGAERCAYLIGNGYHLCVFYTIRYNPYHTSLDDDGWYFGINQRSRV